MYFYDVTIFYSATVQICLEKLKTDIFLWTCPPKVSIESSSNVQVFVVWPSFSQVGNGILNSHVIYTNKNGA